MVAISFSRLPSRRPARPWYRHQVKALDLLQLDPRFGGGGLSKLQQEGHSRKELEAQLQTNLAQAKGHKVEAVSLSAFPARIAAIGRLCLCRSLVYGVLARARLLAVSAVAQK